MPVFASNEVVPTAKSGVFIPRGKMDVQGLTASATRINTPERESMRRVIQPWQSLALSYYDAIGEIHYAAQFYSRAMQNVRYFVGERDENDEIVPSKNEDAKALWDRVQDPGGGRRMLNSRWGQLGFITGEALLMWTGETSDDEERWEILSNDELRGDGANGYLRMRAPALGAQPVPAAKDGDWFPVKGEVIVYRVWVPHPRFSALADSPMRGILDLCKELLTLTQAVNAQAISHAARAGLLLVPEEIDFPSATIAQDEDPDTDVFQVDLNEALMTAIADPSSAAALSPLVVRAAAEYLHPDVFRWMGLSDPQDRYPEENLRTEAIRRMALGMDMPPEELLGKADVNHWTSFEITEDAWKHVEPFAWAFAQSLATAYLRPTARKEGIEGWERLCIGVDESAAVVKPDRGNAANEVYDRGGISDEELRAAHDFGEDERMDDEEYQTWLAIKLGDSTLLPEKWQPQSFKDAQTQKAEAAKAFAENGPPNGDAQAAQDGKSGAEKRQQPDTQPQDGGDVQEAAQTASLNGDAAALVASVMGAADMAHWRAREKAGVKAKAAAQGNPDAKAQIQGVPTDAVAATLGPKVVADLGLVSTLGLVAGGADHFAAQAVRWGWTDTQARALAEMIEAHAARSLFDTDPAPLPAGFAGHVRRTAP